MAQRSNPFLQRPAKWQPTKRSTATKAVAKRQPTKLVQASKIRAEVMDFLWDERIPLDGVTLLAGMEGLGKGALVAALVAKVTRGTLPGDFFGQRSNVIMMSAEDSYAAAMRPRLEAAGADLDRVYFVTAEDERSWGYLSLPNDLAELEDHVRSVNAVLVVTDPVMSFVSDKVDANAEASVRGALKRLQGEVERLNISFLAVIHTNKKEQARWLDKVMGSKAWTAVARCVLAVGRDPDDEGWRLCIVAKSNNGRTAPDVEAVRFRLEGTQYTGHSRRSDGPKLSTVVYVVEETTKAGVYAEDVLRPAERDDTKVAEAAETMKDIFRRRGTAEFDAETKLPWLVMPSEALRRSLGEISDATWDRAKKRLFVQSDKRGKHWFVMIEPLLAGSSVDSSFEADEALSPHNPAPTSRTSAMGVGLLDSSQEHGLTREDAPFKNPKDQHTGTPGGVTVDGGERLTPPKKKKNPTIHLPGGGCTSPGRLKRRLTSNSDLQTVTPATGGRRRQAEARKRPSKRPWR